MYQEIQPSHGVQKLVDSFWLFKNSQGDKSERFKVLPDGCTDWIFDLNSDSSFVSGAMTHHQIREVKADANLIGVRFKTEAFSSLSKVPLTEIKNQRIEASQVVSGQDDYRLDQLHELSSVSDKLGFLEKHILSLRNQLVIKEDQMVLSLVDKIRIFGGANHVKDLAKSYHVSMRQLERRFKGAIGLSIKEFSNVIRFNHTTNLISSQPGRSLLEIAYHMGFFDHAHMTHEFQRVSGQNPSDFR